MSDLLLLVTVILIFIEVMSLLEYWVKTKGSLFSGAATPRRRILALLLGTIFMVLFVGKSSSSDGSRWEFLVVAIALVGYSLGVSTLLQNLQRRRNTKPIRQTPSLQPDSSESIGLLSPESEPVQPINRLGRFFLILGVGLALAIVAIYAALQVATHPDNPLSLLLLIGLIVLVAIAYLRHWFRLFTGR